MGNVVNFGVFTENSQSFRRFIILRRGSNLPKHGLDWIYKVCMSGRIVYFVEFEPFLWENEAFEKFLICAFAQLPGVDSPLVLVSS